MKQCSLCNGIVMFTVGEQPRPDDLSAFTFHDSPSTVRLLRHRLSGPLVPHEQRVERATERVVAQRVRGRIACPRVRDARCAEELQRNATIDKKLYVRCGLLDASAWIFPDRVRALVASAVEKSARFAPAFAARGAESGAF